MVGPASSCRKVTIQRGRFYIRTYVFAGVCLVKYSAIFWTDVMDVDLFAICCAGFRVRRTPLSQLTRDVYHRPPESTVANIQHVYLIYSRVYRRLRDRSASSVLIFVFSIQCFTSRKSNTTLSYHQRVCGRLLGRDGFEPVGLR